MTTVVVLRPRPTRRATLGLSKITGLDVHFAKCAESNEEAALDHLNELIAWWGLRDMRSHERRLSVTKGDTPHRKKRRPRR